MVTNVVFVLRQFFQTVTRLCKTTMIQEFSFKMTTISDRKHWLHTNHCTCHKLCEVSTVSTKTLALHTFKGKMSLVLSAGCSILHSTIAQVSGPVSAVYTITAWIVIKCLAQFGSSTTTNTADSTLSVGSTRSRAV